MAYSNDAGKLTKKSVKFSKIFTHTRTHTHTFPLHNKQAATTACVFVYVKRQSATGRPGKD